MSKKADMAWMKKANEAYHARPWARTHPRASRGWTKNWLAARGRTVGGILDEHSIQARCDKFDLERDEIQECALCESLVWFRDAYAPGDDLLCHACNKELTGRGEGINLFPMVDPPPSDVYHPNEPKPCYRDPR